MSQRQLYIVTSAALPWRTGTAINPLIKAAQLSCLGLSVCLLIPWIGEADQSRIFGSPSIVSTQNQQRLLSLDYLKNLNLPEIDIEFYNAELLDFYGIVPSSPFWVNLSKEAILIMEEPEHLLLPFPLAKLKVERPDLYILGIVHTNYPYFWRKYFPECSDAEYEMFSQVIFGRTQELILQRNIHKLFVLSDAINFYPKAIIRNCHGVADAFFKSDTQNGTERSAYFIGKIILEKGMADLAVIAKMCPQVPLDVFGAVERESPAPQLFSALSHVSLKGASHEPWKDIIPYKIFINPSQSEVLCTTTLEAVAMNKIVILPDVRSNNFFKKFPRCFFYRDLDQAANLLKELLLRDDLPLNDIDELSWANVVQKFYEDELRFLYE